MENIWNSVSSWFKDAICKTCPKIHKEEELEDVSDGVKNEFMRNFDIFSLLNSSEKPRDLNVN